MITHGAYKHIFNFGTSLVFYYNDVWLFDFVIVAHILCSK
jgi:hypothetical protein